MKRKGREIKQSNVIESRIYDRKTMNKINSKLNLFGLERKINALDFLNFRFLSTVIVFLFAIVLDYGYFISPLIALIYFILIYHLIIEVNLKNRSFKLESEAMHFFEVLTLSLETGKNLEDALITTCRNVDGALSDEFKVAMSEIKFGKSLDECLKNMKYSIPSETINNIIISITQSNLFGSGVVNTLYNQIEYLRQKKILEVKAQISKVPTKISVISVLFFVPLVLMIILAPVILQSIN